MIADQKERKALDSVYSLLEKSDWLDAFPEYLEKVKGVCQGTSHKYGFFTRRFIEFRFGEDCPTWASVNPEDVANFILKEASRLPRSSRKPVDAIRALLRFLVSLDAVDAGLIGAVPPIRTWKHSELPRRLSDDEVERVLRACADGCVDGGEQPG